MMEKSGILFFTKLGEAKWRCPIVLLALSFGQGKCWLSDKGGCDGVTLALCRLTGVTTTSDPRGGRTRLSPLSICSHTSQCSSSALLSKAHIGKWHTTVVGEYREGELAIVSCVGETVAWVATGPHWPVSQSASQATPRRLCLCQGPLKALPCSAMPF